LNTISAPFRPSSRALREVAVVADVDADRREARLEDRIAKVARLEEVLLPEARGVRDMVLAVLPEIGAVVVVDRGGVVVDTRLLAFVDRHDHRHPVPFCALGDEVGGRPWHALGDVVPVRVLRRTEVRAVEDLLQPQDLDALLAGLVDERQVDVDGRLTDLLERGGRVGQGSGCLDQAADDSSRHVEPSSLNR
jgi:hypothetical protein